MMRRFRTLSLLFCIAFCALAYPSYAQQPTTTPTLRVTVLDVSGQPVPGASCVLHPPNDLKSIVETAVTNEQGVATFSTTVVGNYVLHVERSGFNPFDKDNVAIKDNESSEIKVNLTISSVEASVTVTGESDS